MTHNARFEDKIAKDLDQEVAIEKAQLQRVGGMLTTKQEDALNEIDWLIQSLGPTQLEDELDSSNYSRPVPRAPNSKYQPLQKEKSRAATSNESAR